MKDLIEKLKTANDGVEKVSELSDAERNTILRQINQILLTLLMAALRKNT